MRTLQRLGLGLIVLSMLVLLLSTGGVTGVTGVRDADVVTSADGSAYLGIESEGTVVLDPGRTDGVTLLTLTNMFPTALDEVAVTVTDAGEGPPRLASEDAPARLAVGASGDVTADVVCSGRDGIAERWTVTVEASGEDTSVRTSREVAVRCRPAGPPENPGPSESSGPPENPGPPESPGRP